MAITEQITCDVCGKQKGEVNHWWMYDTPKPFATPYIGFVVWHWDAETAKGYKHACGQECVIKAVSEFLSTGKRAE